MDLEIVRADPAGNITVFVMDPPPDSGVRAAIVTALLADPFLRAQQAGFVVPPSRADGLWKLQMMGGEFCGNASRAFGLLVARKKGLSGSVSLMIETSGAAKPLRVNADTLSSSAEIDLPAPLAEKTVEFEGRLYPLYVFEGISHVIAADTIPDVRLVCLLHERAESQLASDAGLPRGAENALDAFGVMYYDTCACFMRPVVYVRQTGTVVAESSCGSGSAALALWAAGNSGEADEQREIAQPGGTITTRVKISRGVVQKITIGGPVELGEPAVYTCPGL